MDGPRVCQTEGRNSERENRYHILTHISGIFKNGTEEPIFREGIETWTYRMEMWTQRRGEDGGMN